MTHAEGMVRSDPRGTRLAKACATSRRPSHDECEMRGGHGMACALACSWWERAYRDLLTRCAA